MFSGVVVMCPRGCREKEDECNRYTTNPCTYCVQVVAGRKKIICILPSVPTSLFQRRVMDILVHWFSFGANFHHLMTHPKNIYISCSTFTKDFCGKNVPKLPDFGGIISEIVI
jgi:hypothetical protein